MPKSEKLIAAFPDMYSEYNYSKMHFVLVLLLGEGVSFPGDIFGVMLSSCPMSGLAGVCKTPFVVLSVSCSVSTHL